MKRILVVTSNASPHLLPLMNAWIELGNDVSVLTDRPIGRFGPAMRFSHPRLKLVVFGRSPVNSVSVSVNQRSATRRLLEERLSGASQWAQLRHLPQVVRSHDVVVVDGYVRPLVLAVLSMPLSRRPPAVMLAERPDHRTRGTRRLVRDYLIRWALRRSCCVWAMSEISKNIYIRYGAKVSALAPYPSPDYSFMLDETFARRSSEALRVAVVGALTDRKNPLLAVEALKLLAEFGVSFRATIYGDGPLRPSVEKAVVDLPIHVVGHVEHDALLAALRDSDVLLHTCSDEGWGMAIAEAVALEVAVVAGPWADAACEFATRGSTVRIVELVPRHLALELANLAGAVGSPTHREALRVTRVAVADWAGATSVAKRTAANLEHSGMI